MRKPAKSFQDLLVCDRKRIIILSDDLEYDNALELSPKAEGISTLLDAYLRSILTPDS